MDRVRFGFTVVEMLVVIAIIGVLASLLMVSLGPSIDNGRQVTCTNNLRQLGEAVAIYTAAKGELPPLRKQVSSGSNEVYLGWPHLLLPELGAGGLAAQLNANVNSAAPNPASVYDGSVKVLACPTDVSPSSDDNYRLSYAVNAGCPNDYSNPLLDAVGNGVFIDHITSLGGAKYQKQRFLLSDFEDGASNTILISENADADIWPTLSSVNLTQANAATSELAGGIVWYPGSDTSTNPDPLSPPVVAVSGVRTPLIGNPNAGRGTVVSFAGAGAWQYAAPSSRHNNVILMTFGDGSVRKIRQTLDYGVYCLLMSPNGQKCFDPASGTPPTRIGWQASRRVPPSAY